MCPLTACWVPLILRLSSINVGLGAIAIWYTIWFSKARNAFSPGMIDRLTYCVEPKRSLEAGALCVEVLVLLTVIRGTEVVLVPRTFECSLHGVHTLQCLKIEMGPSLVLQTYRCLGVCWVMPSWVFVFVYLSEILELACSLACVNFVLYLDWGFCLVTFYFCSTSKELHGTQGKRMWAAIFLVILLFASLPWNHRGVSGHTRPYAEPSLTIYSFVV